MADDAIERRAAQEVRADNFRLKAIVDVLPAAPSSESKL